MPPHSDPRPVSGEIVTDAPAGAFTPRPPAGDVVDAEFEIVEAGHRAAVPPRPTAPLPPGLGVLAATEGPVCRQRGGVLFWTAGLAIAAAAFWVSGGHALFLGPDGRALAAEPLKVARLVSRVETGPAGQVLLVDGELENEGSASRMVPRFSIDVATRSGRTFRYFLGTSDAEIAAGGRFGFSGRLPAPKDRIEAVTLTFRDEAGV